MRQTGAEPLKLFSRSIRAGGRTFSRSSPGASSGRTPVLSVAEVQAPARGDRVLGREACEKPEYVGYIAHWRPPGTTENTRFTGKMRSGIIGLINGRSSKAKSKGARVQGCKDWRWRAPRRDLGTAANRCANDASGGQSARPDHDGLRLTVQVMCNVRPGLGPLLAP